MTSVRPALFATAAAIALALPALPLTARDARPATHPAPARTVAPATYATGTVVLKLHRSVPNHRRGVQFDVPALDAVMQQIGATARTPLFPRAQSANALVAHGAAADPGFDRVYIVSYGGPYDAKWVSERLAETQVVDYAEPYWFFSTEGFPVDDPQAAQQYWLSIIKAQEAWEITRGSEEVVIAIVDSGVDWMHEDLADNIWENPGEVGRDAQNRDRRSNGVDDDENGFVDDWHGWDLVGNASFSEQMSRVWRPDNDASPRLMNIAGYSGYHGTTVAGCAAASTNNGKGIASPGYNAKILPVKAAADSSIQSINAGYEGIVYAADMRATIINCSFGGAIQGGSQALQQLIDYARAQGSLIVAASGNSGQNVEAVVHVPAGLKGVLSVGATSSSDFADTSYTNSGLGVHVYAPGTNVLTTYPGNTYAGNGVTGTSFSSPITSGVASLVVAMHPTWTPEQVMTQLRVTGDRVKINAASRFAPHFYRRINAFRAVSYNRSLDAGDRMPGLSLESYSINGRARDTVRALGDVLNVRLNLTNLLAPTTNLTVDTWPGQMLRARTAASVPTIASGASAAVDLQLEIDPESAERFSDGSFNLVLRLRDGEYEDLIPISIPVKLDGWRRMATFGGPSATYATQSIAVTSPNVAWAVANVNEQRPAFTRLTDGKSWQTFRNIATANEPVYCVAAYDDQTAWAGASPQTGGVVYRTTNGGTAWQRVAVSTITPFINAIHFFDERNGILIGDPRSGRWGIGITSDGGATWTALPTPVPAGAGEAGWNNSFAAFGDNVWFGTNNNRIFRSTDQGRTWTSSQTPSVASFSLAFTSATNGMAVFKRTVVGNAFTGANALAVTRNGGESWQSVQLPFGMTADAVTTIPGTDRIAVATESGIVETTDLGQTWTVVAAPTAVFNWKVSESGARYGTGVMLGAASADGIVAAYGVNATGTIIGYREGSATTAAPDESAATRSGLMEPYPNPALGTTTLGFELESAADVTLRLVDARGAEVASLMAERRAAGRHAVVVDASTLAAGTYHAVLTVDGVTSSRSVVVIH